MDKPEFVDAHVHFYDMQHPDLFYAHWQPDVVHPSLGTLPRKLAERNWLAEDFIEVSRSSNVTKAVHVQAAIGSDDPVKETEWLQEAAERTGFPQAIVAYADLRDPDVEATLERHCEYENMGGIRDFSYGDYLVEPDFHRGYALLEKVRARSQHSSAVAGYGETCRAGVEVSKHPNRHRPCGSTGRANAGVLRELEVGNADRRNSGEHHLQDFGARHGRSRLDSRKYSSLRPLLHRGVWSGAQPVRDELAGGQPVQ